VLLTGPVGTGKTRLAQHLHERSRRPGPFVAFNCSAIPVNLEEATLFGVASGFIPGVREREGWVVRARAGTLFLDELAEMPLVAQAKLLDAFDPTDPGFIPVGGTARVRPTCRLVSATNRDVFALAAAGTLRQDLLSRIVVAQVAVPSLAERREDLIELLDRALHRRGATMEGAVPTAELAEALLLARWTENVRGLESLAARLSLGERLSADEVRRHAERGLEGAPVSEGAAPHPARLAASRPLRPLWPPEPAELLTLLREHDFNVAAAAAAIGRRRETLSRLTTATFGAGGAAAARRAFRIYEETGRVPPREPLDD
jgi:DNA-binding NtrC family response regulator